MIDHYHRIAVNIMLASHDLTHRKLNSNSYNCNQNGTPRCSKYVESWPQPKISHLCVGYITHTDITTAAYIYGYRKSWRYKDPSSITYLGLSKGDFIARMLILLRSIPGIRGRFIPHKECQESGVNVTS